MRRHWLYRHFDKDKQLLYIGRSNSVFVRLSAHQASSLWAAESVMMAMEYYPTHESLVIAEKLAIEAEDPLHNKDYSCRHAIYKKRLATLAPVTAVYHPDGLSHLSREPSSVQLLLHHLVSRLNSATQKNKVTLPYKVLAEELSLSRTKLLTCLSSLVEGGFIYKPTRQSYFIAPDLAWFGTEMIWGLCLYRLAAGCSLQELHKLIETKQLVPETKEEKL